MVKTLLIFFLLIYELAECKGALSNPDHKSLFKSFEGSSNELFNLQIGRETLELELEDHSGILHETNSEIFTLNFEYLREFEKFGLILGFKVEKNFMEVFPAAVNHERKVTRWTLPWIKFFKKLESGNNFLSLSIWPGVRDEGDYKDVSLSSFQGTALSWGYFYKWEKLVISGDLSLQQSGRSRAIYGNGRETKGAYASFWKNLLIKRKIKGEFWGVFDLSGALYTGTQYKSQYFVAQTDRGYGLTAGIGIEKNFDQNSISLKFSTSSILQNVYESSFGSNYDFEEEHSALWLRWDRFL